MSMEQEKVPVPPADDGGGTSQNSGAQGSSEPADTAVNLADTQFEMADEPEDELPPPPPVPTQPSRGPLSVVPIPSEDLELEKPDAASPTPPELNPDLWDDPRPEDDSELLVGDPDAEEGAAAEALDPEPEVLPAPEDDDADPLLAEAEEVQDWHSESPAPDPQERLETTDPLPSAEPTPQPPEKPPLTVQPTLEAVPPVLPPAPAVLQVPAPAVPSSPPVDSAPAAPDTPPAQGDLLEEVILPSTTGEQSHPPGEHLVWGGQTFVVGPALPRGWYSGQQGEQAVLLRFDGQDPYPSLPAHRLTVRPLYAGPEGYALPDSQGVPYGGVMPLEKALSALTGLAQYVYALEKQGYALLDLDPQGILDTPQGPRLRFPPRLSRIGETTPVLEREGYTAPELREGRPASGKEGVYLLGALLLEWLTGEKPLTARLENLRVSGAPQLVYRSLTAAQARYSPLEFLNALRALSPAPRPTYVLGHVSTVGLNPDRPVNEDSYGFRVERVGTVLNDLEQIRAVVCDGMGGMAAGEVASDAAVRAFLEAAHDLEPSTLERAVWEANKAVLEAMQGQEGGCTITGAVIEGTRFTLAHVGDSRGYKGLRGGLEQLSQDHSLVAAMVASGVITASEAKDHPDRNKILRSLGSVRQEQAGYVQTLAGSLAPGEALILLSDGVWGEVDDLEIRELWLKLAQEPQRLAEVLVHRSLEQGAPDNATALIVLRSS